MEQILINLIAGALGGVGAGKASPTFDLGTAGNIISGLVGGGVLGQIATLALPAVVAAAQSGNLSIGGIVSQAIAGGAPLGQCEPAGALGERRIVRSQPSHGVAVATPRPSRFGRSRLRCSRLGCS